MRNSYDDFLRRINQYRQHKKLTQAETGSLIGKTQSQFSKMELGKTVISYRALMELKDEGWDIDYIITGRETVPASNSLTGFLDEKLGESFEGLKEVLIFAIGKGLEKDQRLSDADIKCEYELLKLVLNQTSPDTILSDVRSMLQLTQMTMAERLGVNIKKYRDLERDNTKPDAELLSIIYEISHCRPSVFFYTESVEKYLLDSLWNEISSEKQRQIIAFLEHAICLYFL